MNWIAGAITAALLAGCGSDNTSPSGVDGMSDDGDADSQIAGSAPMANVTGVSVSGTDNAYTFAVTVASPDSVWIRAHMNTSGYGGDVFSGTAEGGFSRADQTRVFPVDIEQSEPLPDGCAF